MTSKSNKLREEVITRLKENNFSVNKIDGKFKLYRINNKVVNLRTTTVKTSSGYYWFDAQPHLYENPELNIDFLIYVCGTKNSIYIFPTNEFRALIFNANVGGRNGLPHFDIDLRGHKFLPSGQNFHNISQFFNNLSLLS